MTNQEIMITDENYKSILAYENKTAQLITFKVLEKPELSAWMILFPIVFIPFMQRQQKYKQLSKIFSSEYLFTKNIALETAYKRYKQEISPEQALELIAKIVQRNPDTNDIVLNIYRKQTNEIKLLSEHYLALLLTNKDKYGEMIICHYQTKTNYLSFINRLAEVEKEVTRAASATFIDGTIEVPEIMEKMEKHLWEIRLKDANLFFSQG